MAENSKIEWCRHTMNPWRGCTKVSEGCRFCYAETMSKRNPKSLGIWGNNGTRVVASEAGWRDVLKWDRAAEQAGERHRVFCASMADVCEDRDDLIEPRAKLIRTIAATPNLDWLLLTKRPENYLRLFDRWLSDQWPSNVWAGTSVENQEAADKRIPHLLKVPATVRFLSCEPLLGPISLPPVTRDGYGTRVGPAGYPVDGIDWVIVGGSGPGARPCNVAWIRDIVTQCRAAGVPCFVKQVGARPVCTIEGSTFPKHDHGMFIGDRKGGDMAEWPEDLRVREFPQEPAHAAQP